MTWPIRGRIIQDYQAAYPDPLVMQAGDALVLGKRDQQWPGWIWCIAANGMEGWVPESYLEVQCQVGTARCDYTARELTAHAGDALMLWDLEAGWYWASTAEGDSGWIPAENIEVLENVHS